MLKEIQAMIVAEEIKHKKKRAFANAGNAPDQLQMMHQMRV